jgi:hypothetical protein
MRFQITNTANPTQGFAARNIDQVRGLLAKHGLDAHADTEPLDHLTVLDAVTIDGWRIQRIR